jgi:hypothetical protein
MSLFTAFLEVEEAGVCPAATAAAGPTNLVAPVNNIRLGVLSRGLNIAASELDFALGLR